MFDEKNPRPAVRTPEREERKQKRLLLIRRRCGADGFVEDDREGQKERERESATFFRFFSQGVRHAAKFSTRKKKDSVWSSFTSQTLPVFFFFLFSFPSFD